jgi:hypothetical protein
MVVPASDREDYPQGFLRAGSCQLSWHAGRNDHDSLPAHGMAQVTANVAPVPQQAGLRAAAGIATPPAVNS